MYNGSRMYRWVYPLPPPRQKCFPLVGTMGNRFLAIFRKPLGYWISEGCSEAAMKGSVYFSR